MEKVAAPPETPPLRISPPVRPNNRLDRARAMASFGQARAAEARRNHPAC